MCSTRQPRTRLCAAGATQNLKTCFMTTQVANPFYGKVSQGTLQAATVTGNQLLRPFPQYGSISNSGNYIGVSNYSSLADETGEAVRSRGTLLGSYTFSSC